MQKESAAQYVAKLKAKLVADRNTRMAATKPTATKVVVKSQLVGPVRKEPPRTAGFIGPRELHKGVKYLEDVKEDKDMNEAEEVKEAEEVEKAQ